SFSKSFALIPRRSPRACNTMLITRSTLLLASCAASGSGAHPVMTGVFCGIAVHQVGNHGSRENRKHRSERSFAGCVGRRLSQNRFRNLSIILPVFPITK